MLQFLPAHSTGFLSSNKRPNLMRTSTIFLQIICAALGTVFTIVGFAAGAKMILGGLFFGSLLFFFAAILGSDHTVNSSTSSRRVFKGVALLLACPIIVAGGVGCYTSLASAQWLDAVSSVLRLLVFLFVILCFAFDHHPVVRRLMSQFGVSIPKK
jgi:hypothetical protein